MHLRDTTFLFLYLFSFTSIGCFKSNFIACDINHRNKIKRMIKFYLTI
jgi:hypothetical protein